MSLILDALRKLERDKDRPDPGVVVVGSVPWKGRERTRWPPLVGAALAGVLLLALLGFLFSRRPASPAVAPLPAPAAPMIAASPAATIAAPAAPVALSGTSPSVTSVTGATRSPAEAPTPGPAPAARRPALPEGSPAAAPAARGDAASAPAGTAAAPAATSSASATPPASSASAAPAAPPAAPRGAERLQLMAISVRDGTPVAIISDHLVREGDSFDGVRVLRIGTTEVEVEEHGQKRVLRF